MGPVTDESAPASDLPAEGADPLKYYCIVFGVIVLALAIMYVKVNGDRDDYEKANAEAEAYMTGKGLTVGRDGVPRDIPNLAADVERFSAAYKIVGSDAGEGGISFEKMKNFASGAGMTQTFASAPNPEASKVGHFQTVSQKFTYDPYDLRHLVTLVYNIEAEGRLRVSQIEWQLKPDAENTEKPYNKIQKSTIQVSVRAPLATGR